MFTREVLRTLATAEPSRLVVSVYCRTDPRDPANTSTTPAWLINLRNGLGATSERLEAGDDRDVRLAFRPLRQQIEEELIRLEPHERARSVAWMFDVDGSSERFSLQLPLRGDMVVADTKPFVSPLVDVADRGAPTGVILAAGNLVRLMHVEQGEATEPENSSYELSLGDWRSFGGTAGGSPARGLLTTSHQERYEARVEAQRQRLFVTAARETAKRLEALGWERVVLISERRVSASFRDALVPEISERLVAEADLNLVGEPPPTVADAVEPLIEDGWHKRTTALIELADERARAGGAATLGAEETLGALTEGRVAHLILDPDHDFSASAEVIPTSLRGSGEMLAERAVEAAIGTSAQVTAFSSAASATLHNAGGMAALLRY
jgi:hypothetical protein